MSHIDLDVIERDVDHARSAADYFGFDDDGSVSVRLADATLLALVRAVRAAMDESSARRDLLRFQHPPHDDCYRDAARARESHAAKQRVVDEALAPFRKEGA